MDSFIDGFVVVSVVGKKFIDAIDTARVSVFVTG